MLWCKGLQTSHFYYVPQKLRLREFSIGEMKVVFKDIQLSAESQNSPTKWVVWNFCGQSTVLLLRSSCITAYICVILQIILPCTNVIFRNLTGVIYVSSFVKVILGGKWGHFSLESVKIVHFHHLKVRKKTLFLTCILSALHNSRK